VKKAVKNIISSYQFRFLFLFFIVWLILQYLFIPDADDFRWGSQYGVDMLKNGFDIAGNNRFFSNLLIVFFARFLIPKAIFYALIMTGIYYLIVEFTSKSKLMYSLTAFLIFTVSPGIFIDSLVVASFFMNYGLSLLFVLFYLHFAKSCFTKPSKKLTAAALVFAFPAQLVLETASIYLVVLSFLCLALYFYKKRKVTLPLLAWCILSILGFIVLMAGSKSQATGHAYRRMALPWVDYSNNNVLRGYLPDTCMSILKELKMLGIVPVAIISILLIVMIVKLNIKKSKSAFLIACILGYNVLFPLVIVSIYFFSDTIPSYSLTAYTIAFFEVFVSIAFVALSFYIFNICIKDKRLKQGIFFLLGSMLIVILPLMFIYPTGPRNLLLVAVFIIMMINSLLEYMIDQGLIKISIKKISLTALTGFLIVACGYSAIYGVIHYKFWKRQEYIEAQAAQGSKIIYAERLPLGYFTHFPNPTDPLYANSFNVYFKLDENIIFTEVH
jgi:hypothetical protein